MLLAMPAYAACLAAMIPAEDFSFVAMACAHSRDRPYVLTAVAFAPCAPYTDVPNSPSSHG